jgi:hypothetical protein
MQLLLLLSAVLFGLGAALVTSHALLVLLFRLMSKLR